MNEEAIMRTRTRIWVEVQVMQVLTHRCLRQKPLPNLLMCEKRKRLYGRFEQTQSNGGGPTAGHRIRHRQRHTDVHHIIGCGFRQRARVTTIK